MQKIIPHLWFNDQAEEAVNFYVSIFKNSRVGHIARGVSWQIVPAVLGKMMQDKDPAKSENVIKALLHMKKLNIEALKRAYDGK
ncbi:MAG: hypothetical protein FJ215_13840 [Ignavibacteria bacterium]|nr:hypothetical protein [Ignavibacteria bacterium]